MGPLNTGAYKEAVVISDGDALTDHPQPNNFDDFSDDESVLCVEAQIEPHNCSLMNRWPPEPRVSNGHREDAALHELRRATDG